jgi:hypothetical protein
MNLHNQILNIPCESKMPRAELAIYKEGHFNARHAAAELAAQFQSQYSMLYEALEKLEEAARQVMAGEMDVDSIMIERIAAKAALAAAK